MDPAETSTSPANGASHAPSVGQAEFQAYERVRKSGRWNMFDPRARRATGLTAEEYAEVMRRYSELRAQADRD